MAGRGWRGGARAHTCLGVYRAAQRTPGKDSCALRGLLSRGSGVTTWLCKGLRGTALNMSSSTCSLIPNWGMGGKFRFKGQVQKWRPWQVVWVVTRPVDVPTLTTLWACRTYTLTETSGPAKRLGVARVTPRCARKKAVYKRSTQSHRAPAAPGLRDSPDVLARVLLAQLGAVMCREAPLCFVLLHLLAVAGIQHLAL